MPEDDLISRIWRGDTFNDLEIIDVHCHMGRLRQFYIPECGIEEMIKSADRIGVKKLCIAPHVAISFDAKRGNEMAYEAVLNFPDRALAWLVLDPNSPNTHRGEFEKYSNIPQFVGVKIHPEWQAAPINGDGCMSIFEELEKRGGCALVHTWHGSRFCTPSICEEVIKKFPRVPFILAHAGGTWRGADEAAFLANKYENAYIDTSGFEYSRTTIEEIVAKTENSKILFGSDIPYHDIRIAFSRVIFSKISNEIKRAIFADNFKKLLRINDKSGW